MAYVVYSDSDSREGTQPVRLAENCTPAEFFTYAVPGVFMMAHAAPVLPAMPVVVDTRLVGPPP